VEKFHLKNGFWGAHLRHALAAGVVLCPGMPGNHCVAIAQREFNSNGNSNGTAHAGTA
jgi:hypothetical protein